MKGKQERIYFFKNILLILLLTICVMGCGSNSKEEYTASVIMTGGSGRATIENPCTVTVENGQATADIIWSSPYYDYMVVDGKNYYPVNNEGNSEFLIPVELEKEMVVQADTTAMSTPHLIEYTIKVTVKEEESDIATEEEFSFEEKDVSKAPDISGLKHIKTEENQYARGFAIHRYEDGYLVICVNDGRKYLLIPEGRETPVGMDSDIAVLNLPLDRIYLASSGAMCHFDIIGAVGDIRLSGLERDDWYIEGARSAMDSGEMLYGGKYSAPDYEKMLLQDIDLAIENTMILHVPKVQEKLEQLGIPVFIDRSSYEADPLGRCEWIRVYGAITSKEKEAQSAFEYQRDLVSQVQGKELSGKSVSFFYVNSNHQIVTRRSNDYFAKMVSMAGGTYLSPDEPDKDRQNGQITISMEAFYDYGTDADILIYNSAIADAPDSLSELCSDNSSFRDFKAVKEGQVFYTDKSLYQYTDRTGTIIENLNEIISDNADDTEFFHRLR